MTLIPLPLSGDWHRASDLESSMTCWPNPISVWQSKTIPARDILPLFEIALVLVRFDHAARFIVNANHGAI